MTIAALVGQLARPETRTETARALARTLGAEDLVLFLRDPELNVFLPAPGFVQTIRHGAEWRALLAESLANGSSTGRMGGPARDEPVDAWGFYVEPDALLVVMGGSLDLTAMADVLPLIPLVAAIGAGEGEARSLHARAAMSNNAVAKGEVLAHALERSRDRLRVALAEASEARRLVMSMNEQLFVTAAEADRARASAEEANRGKSGFLAMMSHELRTPLNAIGGYASLLEEGIMGPLVPGQREYLTRIKRSQSHLLALINDVLNFAKAESGTIAYKIETLVLAQVLDSVAPLIEPMARAKGVEYMYVAPPIEVVVPGDRDKIVQVVLNLLTNAVKFTPIEGCVRLHVEHTADRELVVVTDSGPGIPDDRSTSIFEPFVQLERSFAGEREGVGLGLSISRELARGMGGDVTVDSATGGGSRFTFALRRTAGATGGRADGRESSARQGAAK